MIVRVTMRVIVLVIMVPMIMVLVPDAIRSLPHTQEASDGRRARPCGFLLPRGRRGRKLGQSPLHLLELRGVGAE
jgi:hypothetical protein